MTTLVAPLRDVTGKVRSRGTAAVRKSLDSGEECLLSYSTPVAAKSDGKVLLDVSSWDYSQTTVRHVKIFLGDESVKDVRRKIKDGTYILKDINPK